MLPHGSCDVIDGVVSSCQVSQNNVAQQETIYTDFGTWNWDADVRNGEKCQGFGWDSGRGWTFF